MVTGVADRHELRQAHDVGVLQPHAAVRDPAGDQAGLVGPVHAHVAAARPVGQGVRRRARPERHRAVEGTLGAVAGQLGADVELALGRRPLRLADADAGLEDLLALLDQGHRERAGVDLQPRVERLRLAQRVRGHPAPGPVRAGSACAPGTRCGPARRWCWRARARARRSGPPCASSAARPCARSPSAGRARRPPGRRTRRTSPCRGGRGSSVLACAGAAAAATSATASTSAFTTTSR